jgi:hypothetical protein
MFNYIIKRFWEEKERELKNKGKIELFLSLLKGKDIVRAFILI